MIVKTNLIDNQKALQSPRTNGNVPTEKWVGIMKIQVTSEELRRAHMPQKKTLKFFFSKKQCILEIAKIQRSAHLLQGKDPMSHLSICPKSVYKYVHYTINYSNKRTEYFPHVYQRCNTCYRPKCHMPWEESLQFTGKKDTSWREEKLHPDLLGEGMLPEHPWSPF